MKLRNYSLFAFIILVALACEEGTEIDRKKKELSEAKAELFKVDISHTILSQANVFDASLADTHLVYSKLAKTNFRQCNLHHTTSGLTEQERPTVR